MTVRELIQKLQAMPQDAKVVVRGYEDGVDDISEINLCKLKALPYPNPDCKEGSDNQPRTIKAQSWRGVYDIAEDGDIEAVYIAEDTSVQDSTAIQDLLNEHSN